MLSLSTIIALGLYTPVFGIPPALTGKTSGVPEAQSSATNAASILYDLLAPTSTLAPPVHHLLLDHAREDSDVRQRLVFGAALTPWKPVTYLEHKKYVPLAKGIIKEGLKVSLLPTIHSLTYALYQIGGQGNFIHSVPSLFAAHEKISSRLLEEFRGESERVSIGMYACPRCVCLLLNHKPLGLLLRDKHVHDPRNSTYWPTSLLFSLVQGLVESIDQDTLDGRQSRPSRGCIIDHHIAKTAEHIIRTYNAFVDRVVELKLIGSIEEPPRLNVSAAVLMPDITAELGSSRGRKSSLF